VAWRKVAWRKTARVRAHQLGGALDLAFDAARQRTWHKRAITVEHQ